MELGAGDWGLGAGAGRWALGLGAGYSDSGVSR